MFEKKEQTKTIRDIITGEGYKTIICNGESIRVLQFDGGNTYRELDEHISNGFKLIGFSGKAYPKAILLKPNVKQRLTEVAEQ